MKYTSIFKFKKPDRLDPIKIDDLNDNVDLFENAITDLKSNKLDVNGNASNLLLQEISVMDSEEELSAGYSLSKLFGIIKKQISDIKANLLQSVKISDIYDGTDSANTKIPASAASVKNVQDQMKQIENSVLEIKEKENTYPSRFSNSIILKSSGKTTLQLHDSSDAPVVDLNILGASEQVTTTGAQILPIDTIDVAGSKTYDNFILDINSGTYTLSVSDIINNPSNAAIVLRLYDADNNELAKFEGAVTSLLKGQTIDVPNGVEGARMYVNNALSCLIMLNEGNDIKPWEPYTGKKTSPNPEYPQPIISVGTVSTGAQLLPYPYPKNSESTNGVTFTADDTGSIKIQGTSAAALGTYRLTNNLVLSPGIYSKNIAPTGIGFLISKYEKASNTYVETAVARDIGTFDTTGWDYNAYDYKALLQIIDSGVTFDAVFCPMINAGNKVLPWEPYTGGKPIPSVEYPQTLEVGVTGKQLQSLVDEVITHVGVTLTVKNDAISLLGTATYSGGRNTLKLPDVILPAGRYTMSLSESITATTVITDETNYILVQGENIKQLNFTTKNESIIHIGFNVVGGNTYNITNLRIMLNAGNTSLPWEPYRSATAAITLTEPLRSIGDVHDQIMCRDGVWGIERRISSVTYDGVKNTMYYQDFGQPDPDWCYLSNFGRLSDSISTKGEFLCDKFGYLGNPQKVKNNYCAGFNESEGYKKFFYVQIKKSDLVSLDVDGANLYLKSNPVTVHYLCSHAWEPFPAATQAALNALHTYQGTTHISVIDPLSPEVTVEYVADTKNYIENEHDKLRSEFNTQIAHILSLLPTETQAAMINTETNQRLESVESE